MALVAGTKLGPYEIIALLGAGGMGEVYRARDSRLARDVAIKVLPAAFARDPERLRRFEQEARAAGLLNHPNVLIVFDLGTHDGSPYVVSELLEGETLRERLKQGPLPPRRVIEYGSQIAGGLAAAHQKGIVHRDLKPENLFITDDGRVKILDFGLAKLTRPEVVTSEDATSASSPGGTDPGMVMGTAGYMSPEQVRAAPTDLRSDIFSLGAILYEMLSGKRAFHGDSSIETMNAILKEDPAEFDAQAAKVPPGLERVLKHCLEKNPVERFQSASDVAFDLEALSTLSGATPRTVAESERRKWVRPAMDVVAVTLALVIGILIGRRGGPVSQPSFQQLTFRRGFITKARFAPDNQTIIYSAAWDGDPTELFSTNPASPGSRSLDLKGAELLSISPNGEMAVMLRPGPGPRLPVGTLAQVPFAGGAPREILDSIQEADWAPDNNNLAVVHEVSGRSRLEFPIGKVLYETAGWISSPRVSPQGDRVAFLDHAVRPDNAGSVAVVDLAGSKTTLSEGWSSEGGLAWVPRGDEVWFSASKTGNSDGLYGVAISGTLRLIERMAGGFNITDIARDGRVLIAHGNYRLGIVALGAGESKERDLSWLDWSRVMDISADGKTILFDETSAGGGENYSVYLRQTDGSPAVRLGDGTAESLSPDGKWAAVTSREVPQQICLLPTGSGQERTLTTDRLNHVAARWLPDGKGVVFAGYETGHGTRLYIQDVGGSSARAISPEGVGITFAVSPDGHAIAANAGDRLTLFPVEGGEAKTVPGPSAGEMPVQWTADGRSLFVFARAGLAGRVYRVEVSSGKKQLWKELIPPDPAGFSRIDPTRITPDGKSYAYSYGRTLSDLFLVRGLK